MDVVQQVKIPSYENQRRRWKINVGGGDENQGQTAIVDVKRHCAWQGGRQPRKKNRGGNSASEHSAMLGTGVNVEELLVLRSYWCLNDFNQNYKFFSQNWPNQSYC